MEMVRIEPKKIRTRLLGHDVELTVTAASAPDARKWLNDFVIEADELGDVCCALCMHRSSGDFEVVSGRLFTSEDGQPLRYAGTWLVLPDYEVLFRIQRWRSGCNPDEELTKQAFEQTFDTWNGGQYYERWLACGRSVDKMIALLGEQPGLGRKFLDMVMEQVCRYEFRLRKKS